MKLISIFLIGIFFSIASYGYSQDAQEIIKKVQSNYKGIKDAKASFSHSGKKNPNQEQYTFRKKVSIE